MSSVEFASRPFPIFAKLAGLLRNVPVMRFVVASFSALLRRSEASNGSFDEAARVAEMPVQHIAVVVKPSDQGAIAAPTLSEDPETERKKLILRRWAETGVKMWNPDVHGAGHAALCIQGRVELLPPNPGETLPRYDRLEFKLIEGNIICEGHAVEPPKDRRQARDIGGGFSGQPSTH